MTKNAYSTLSENFVKNFQSLVQRLQLEVKKFVDSLFSFFFFKSLLVVCSRPVNENILQHSESEGLSNWQIIYRNRPKLSIQ